MSARARVLFVDDEENLLRGLRRQLRPLRDRWDMEFCVGGQAAIERMQRDPVCEAIVTDMRMPGIDGAGVLAAARDRWPDTVRVILSGQSDKEAILRAIGPCHRYLAKPCDTRLVQETVDGALALRRELDVPALRRLVAGLDTLPGDSTLYLEIVRVLEEPNVSAERVAEIVQRDVRMSAAVLRIVNSSYFGTTQPIADIGHAVAFLGLDTITSVALGTQLLGMTGRAPADRELERIQDDSLECAGIARMLARDVGLGDDGGRLAFTVALLARCGRLLLRAHDTERYGGTADASLGATIVERERAVYGVSQAQLAAYVLALWGLPDRISEPVAYQDAPSRLGSLAPDTATVLHVATYLVGSRNGELDESYLDTEHLDALGLTTRLPCWAELRVAEQARR